MCYVLLDLINIFKFKPAVYSAYLSVYSLHVLITGTIAGRQLASTRLQVTHKSMSTVYPAK